MRETDRIRDAFRYYRSLGADRTYAQVARKFGVGLRTVQRWGSALQWVRRAWSEPLGLEPVERPSGPEPVGRRVERHVQELSQDDDLNLRRLVRVALRTFLRELEEKHSRNEPACDSISELEKLVKLHLLLAGDDRPRTGPEEVVLRFSPRPALSAVEGVDGRPLSPESPEELP